MPRYQPIPLTIFKDRMEWFAEATAQPEGHPNAYPRRVPDLNLLISGLRKADSPRWEIGIIDARIGGTPDDPYVVFQMNKPQNRRREDERPESERYYDPAAAFVQQAHVLFGYKLGLGESKSHQDEKAYHYPIIKLPPRHFRRFVRFIVDAPPGRLAHRGRGQENQETFHDLRRRHLKRPWLTQGQATATYGPQKSGRYTTRTTVIEESLAVWDRNHKASNLELGRGEYGEMLWAGYDLLDRHPPRDSAPGAS